MSKTLFIGYLVVGIVICIFSILGIYDAKDFYYWGIVGLPLSFIILLTSYGLSNQKQWSYMSALIVNFILLIVSILAIIGLFNSVFLEPHSTGDPSPAFGIIFLNVPLYIFTFVLATSVVIWNFVNGSTAYKIGKWIYIPFTLATLLGGWFPPFFIIPILLFFFIQKIKEFEFVTPGQEV